MTTKKKTKMVRGSFHIIGFLLILLGLDVLLFQPHPLVAGVYLLAGIVLMLYALCFERLRRLVHVAVGVFYALPVLLILFLGVYGRIHTADFDEDVVVVLGAGLIDDEIAPALEMRLRQALVYFEHNPDATFVVCGGYGVGQSISEARAMADFLVAYGVPEAQILLEDASTSTYENFAFALEILEVRYPDGFRAVVITNAFHQYRSNYLARHFGIEATRFASPTPIRSWHRNYMRESLAVLNTWLFQTRP